MAIDRRVDVVIFQHGELRRHILMARMHNFSIEQYALLAAQSYNQFRIPVAMSCCTSCSSTKGGASANLDLKGTSLMDFLSVYFYLRSFSVSSFISPLQIHDFASSVMSNDSTSLFDSIHFSLLTTLRRHLKSLSLSGSVSKYLSPLLFVSGL